jgi:hypothetical protein
MKHLGSYKDISNEIFKLLVSLLGFLLIYRMPFNKIYSIAFKKPNWSYKPDWFVEYNAVHSFFVKKKEQDDVALDDLGSFDIEFEALMNEFDENNFD